MSVMIWSSTSTERSGRPLTLAVSMARSSTPSSRPRPRRAVTMVRSAGSIFPPEAGGGPTPPGDRGDLSPGAVGPPGLSIGEPSPDLSGSAEIARSGPQAQLQRFDPLGQYVDHPVRALQHAADQQAAGGDGGP